MKTTSAEQRVYRGRNYRPQKWVSICPRSVTARGVINAIHYDSVTGSAYEVILSGWDGIQSTFGQTIDIGTTTDAGDVGRVRSRGFSDDSDPDNVILPIALTPPGAVPIAVGNYVSVRLEYSPRQIEFQLTEVYDGDGNLISITEKWDYSETFGSAHVGGAPKPNITGGVSEVDGTPILINPTGWEDSPGLGYREITFDSVHSFAATFGSTIASVLWLWTNGTQPSGAATDARVTLRLGVGFQYVSLYVVDSDGFSAFMRFPIWVHSPDYMPLTNFEMSGDDSEDGRVFSLTLFGNEGEADYSVIPKGCAVCYGELPKFALGAPAASHRTHAFGWISQDDPVLRVLNSERTVTVGGMAYWLDHLDSPTQALRDVGEEANGYFAWPHIDRNRAMWFAIRYYSTMPLLVNVFFSNDVPQTTPKYNLPAGSLLSALQSSASNFSMSVCRCDSFGNLFVERSYRHRSFAERLGIDPLLDLFATDISEDGLVLTTREVHDVALIEAAGSYWDGGNEVLYASLAPGFTRGAGTTTKKLPGQTLGLPVPQKSLNILNGQELAFQNNDQPSVPAKLLDNLDVIEPAWEKPIRVTWAERTVHGIELQRALFMVTKVSVEHSNDPASPSKAITWELSKATLGEEGQTKPVVTQSPGVTQIADEVCGDMTSAFTVGAITCNAVELTNTSTGDYAHFVWITSDGASAVDVSPVSHDFGAPGEYGVRLYLIDECLNFTFSEQAVTIPEETITASFAKIAAGLTVHFADRSTADSGIAAWAWTFGDADSSTDQNPDHPYGAPGTYSVHLHVTSACGAEADDTLEVVVSSDALMPPTAVFRGTDKAVAAFTSDGHLLITADITQTTAIFADHDLSGTLGTVVQDAWPDPFSDLYLGVGGTVDAYALVSETNLPLKVYKVSDVFGARTITLMHSTTDSSTTNGTFTVSRFAPNLLAVSYRNNTALHVTPNQSKVLSTDDAITFHETRVEPTDQSSGADQFPDHCWIFADGTIIAVAQQWTGSFSQSKYYTGSVGGSFAPGANSPSQGENDVAFTYPLHDESDLFEGSDGTSGGLFVNGADQTPIDPISSERITLGDTRAIAFYPLDESIVMLVGATATYNVEVVTDLGGGGTSWTLSRHDSGGTESLTACQFSDDDPEVAIAWGNKQIAYTSALSTSPPANRISTAKRIVGVCLKP